MWVSIFVLTLSVGLYILFDQYRTRSLRRKETKSEAMALMGRAVIIALWLIFIVLLLVVNDDLHNEEKYPPTYEQVEGPLYRMKPHSSP